MLRQLLLPALAFALFATEAATAQTAPAAATPHARQAYRKAAKAQRVLSKREQQAAAAVARAEQARVAAQTAAAAAPAGNTTWSGWSNEPVALPTAAAHRATDANLSVAPGMPLNQIGHGVSTDYNGRPLKSAVASTTLASGR